MNYQKCNPHIVSPYRPMLRARPLVIVFLVFLLNISSYPVYAEQYPQSEEKSLSELIDKYGKGSLITFILDLRETLITIDVNGTLQDSIGRPQPAYVTMRSLLHDLHLIEMSVEQFAAWIPGALKRVEKKWLKAGIEERKKRRAEFKAEGAGRQSGKRCEVQVDTRDESVKDLMTWFEYVKREGGADMEILVRNFKSTNLIIGMVDEFCSQYPHLIQRNRSVKVSLDNLQRQVIDVMPGKQ